MMILDLLYCILHYDTLEISFPEQSYRSVVRPLNPPRGKQLFQALLTHAKHRQGRWKINEVGCCFHIFLFSCPAFPP